MLKSIEDINATKKRIRIEIPLDVIEKEMDGSLARLRQKVRIPGFRQGKAPVNLIEKRYGKEVEAEVLEKVIPEYYSRAIKEADIRPVTMPVLDEEIEFKRNLPLNLSFTVEVLPKIENLDYENIKIKGIPVTVSEQDIEEALKNLQERKAVFEVADKEIEKDDLVTFDYIDSLMADGEDVPSLKEIVQGMGNEIFPPDIMDRVLGKRKGDTVELTYTFDQNFKNREVAGKTVNLNLVIKEVKKKNLPAIDDEFAKDLGCENMAELKEKLRQKLLKIKEDRAEKIYKAEIVNRLIESTTFEVPEAMLMREMDSLMIEGNLPAPAKQETEEYESLSESDILKPEAESGETDSGKRDREDASARIKRKALRNVQASVIIDLIGQKEGITVNDDELNERISLIAQRLSTSPDAVRNFYQLREGALETLRHSIYEDKVLDLLLSKSKIEKEEIA
ncbi:MAG: trigger factor [Nitrospirota bacterium]